MYSNGTFRAASRKYHNLFSFTALSVAGDQDFMHTQMPSCVKIHGRIYHRVLSANVQNPVRWYVHDPNERMHAAATLC